METSLSSRALLATISISCWQARKLDKAETSAVESRHGTSTRAARVSKSLLPNCATLEALQKKSAEIRMFYYRSTLPWGHDGVGILKTDGYLAFVSSYTALKAEFDRLVTAFIADYPAQIATAQNSLNTLFDISDYPAPDELAKKFAVELQFLPVPEASDWRVELGDEHMEHLRDSITAEVAKAQGAAMSSAWRRLHDVVAHAVDKLSAPDAVFRNSMVENAQQLCRLLPSLNIANDPTLDKMAKAVEKALCSHNPSTLRKDSGVRATAAVKLKQVQDIMDRMGPLYGA